MLVTANHSTSTLSDKYQPNSMVLGQYQHQHQCDWMSVARVYRSTKPFWRIISHLEVVAVLRYHFSIFIYSNKVISFQLFRLSLKAPAYIYKKKGATLHSRSTTKKKTNKKHAWIALFWNCSFNFIGTCQFAADCAQLKSAFVDIFRIVAVVVQRLLCLRIFHLIDKHITFSSRANRRARI